MKSLELWHTVKVHNSHNLVTLYREETHKIAVYLHQSANDGQRMNMTVLTGYTVIRPGFFTNPEKERKRPQGTPNREFSTYWESGDTATRWSKTFQKAAAWTREKYGVGEFVSIPGFGRDRFPKEIADWAKAKIAEIKKAQA